MSTELSKKIYALRKQHKLTLEQVAAVVGVGKSTVRKWETGMIANMRRDKIALLAKALHTTPAYLMGWQEDSEAFPSLTTLDARPIMTFYHRVNELCRERGISITALAIELGFSKGTPTNWKTMTKPARAENVKKNRGLLRSACVVF